MKSFKELKHELYEADAARVGAEAAGKTSREVKKDNVDVRDPQADADVTKEKVDKAKAKAGEVVGKADKASEQSGVFLQNVIALLPTSGFGSKKFYNKIRKKWGKLKSPTQYIHLYLTSLYPFWLAQTKGRKVGGSTTTGPVIPEVDANRIVSEIFNSFIQENGGTEVPEADLNNSTKVIQALFSMWKEKEADAKDLSGKNVTVSELSKRSDSDFESLLKLIAKQEYKDLQKVASSVVKNSKINYSIIEKLLRNFSVWVKKPTKMSPIRKSVDLIKIKKADIDTKSNSISKGVVSGSLVMEGASFDQYISSMYVREELNEGLGEIIATAKDKVVGGIKKYGGAALGQISGTIFNDFKPFFTDAPSSFSEKPALPDCITAVNHVNKALNVALKKINEDEINQIFMHRLMKNIPLTEKGWSSDFYSLFEAVETDNFGEQLYNILSWVNDVEIKPAPVAPLIMSKPYKKRAITEAQLSGYLNSNFTALKNQKYFGVILYTMFNIKSVGDIGPKAIKVLSDYYASKKNENGEEILTNLTSYLGTNVSEPEGESSVLKVDDVGIVGSTIQKYASTAFGLLKAHPVLKYDEIMRTWLLRYTVKVSNDVREGDDKKRRNARRIARTVVDSLMDLTFNGKIISMAGSPGTPVFNRSVPELQTFIRERFTDVLVTMDETIQEGLDPKEIISEFSSNLKQVSLIGTALPTRGGAAASIPPEYKITIASKDRMYFIDTDIGADGANYMKNLLHLYIEITIKNPLKPEALKTFFLGDEKLMKEFEVQYTGKASREPL